MKTPAWAERAAVQKSHGYRCVLSLMIQVTKTAYSRGIGSTDQLCKCWQGAQSSACCWAEDLQKPVHSDDQRNVFSRQPHWCQDYNHSHQSRLGNTCGSNAGCRGSDAEGNRKAQLSAKGRKEVVTFAKTSGSSSDSSSTKHLGSLSALVTEQDGDMWDITTAARLPPARHPSITDCTLQLWLRDGSDLEMQEGLKWSLKDMVPKSYVLLHLEV